MESCLGFLQLLFCGTVRSKKRGGRSSSSSPSVSSSSTAERVKIRVGFEGKDTLFSVENLNVKTTFGQYAVLLDYASNRLVPLHRSGTVMEPLEARKRYVVVLNTHGSSSHKWEDLRKSGGIERPSSPRRHSSSSLSSSSSSSLSSPSSPRKHKHGRKRSSSKTPRSKQEKIERDVKEPLLTQEKESGSEDEEENEERQSEEQLTNFSTINFGVSTSMENMISPSREVYVY